MKTIKNITKIFVILSFLILAPSVYASDKSVIVVGKNVDISELSKRDIENIFLGRKTIWNDGAQIHIAISSYDSKKVDQFFDDYVGKSKRRFKKYWLKKVFAGYGIAPRMFKTTQKAIDFVKRQDNSISFITVSDEDTVEGLKIVSVDGRKYF